MFNEEIAMSNTTLGIVKRLNARYISKHESLHNEAANAISALLHLAQYIADNADEVSPRVWSMAAKILEDVR